MCRVQDFFSIGDAKNSSQEIWGYGITASIKGGLECKKFMFTVLLILIDQEKIKCYHSNIVKGSDKIRIVQLSIKIPCLNHQ